MAKVKFFTLVEKTRGSAHILIGQVVEMGGDQFTVAIQKELKGRMSTRKVPVLWGQTYGMMKPRASYEIGDEILVFANKQGGRLDPVFGAQGSLKLQQNWAMQYETAIKGIIGFDVAESTNERKNLLTAMLRGNNRLLHHAALWDFIYLDPEIRKRELVNDETTPAIVGLAKGKDRDVAGLATQVLGQDVGDKHIPILIDLVGSEFGTVAETASQILSRKTGVQKPVKWKQATEGRQKVMMEWRSWWKKNKGKVKLRQ